MTDLPAPQVYRHPTEEFIEVVQGDGRGNHVTIVASADAQPWLVRHAMRQLIPALMPGAREDTHA